MRLTPPSFEDYALAARRIDRDFAKVGTPEGIRRYADHQTAQSWAFVTGVASVLNPPGSPDGSRRHNPDQVLYAVRHGAAKGLMLAHYAFSPFALEADTVCAQAIPIRYSNYVSLERRIQQSTQAVFDFAETGLERLGISAEEWVEQQESVLVSEIETQRYFRIGAGLVVALAHQDFGVRSMRTALERPEEIDWDTELALLDGDVEL